jgi:hypothetical protein
VLMLDLGRSFQLGSPPQAAFFVRARRVRGEVTAPPLSFHEPSLARALYRVRTPTYQHGHRADASEPEQHYTAEYRMKIMEDNGDAGTAPSDLATPKQPAKRDACLYPPVSMLYTVRLRIARYS